MITKARYYEGETFAEFIARPTIKNREMWVALTHRVAIPLEISARVEALHGQWHLLVLSEDWCGDSINIVPIVAKLTESVSNMDMRILERDQNLDIMDAHLTNGKSRSIPIVILVNPKFQECGWWGLNMSPPLPALVVGAKACDDTASRRASAAGAQGPRRSSL